MQAGPTRASADPGGLDQGTGGIEGLERIGDAMQRIDQP
jgi:hypothetical protein